MGVLMKGGENKQKKKNGLTKKTAESTPRTK
jgi:hypothetical protein